MALWILPIAVASIFIFIIIRLRLFGEEIVPGRVAIVVSGSLLFVTLFWMALKSLPVYSEWFLDGAYFYLDLVQIALALMGMFLAAVGLAFYADYWQSKKEELAIQEQKLTILHDLQRDARDPYHLLELLDIATKDIVSHLEETSGALFLVNRQRRQFVLASSVGLNKNEIAALERYPLDRNIVSQSIDLGEPMITGSFSFEPNRGTEGDSRFNSCLILPLISNQEKIGGIILFSEPANQFGRLEIKYLSPVAEWLAEKIHSTRLAKEMSQLRSRVEKTKTDWHNTLRQMNGALKSVSSNDPVTGYCQQIADLANSNSAHLYGLSNGALRVYGGSEPLLELSENYRTALIEALDKNKPIVVNQEAVRDDGQSFISRSSLIFPLGGDDQVAALLLRREGGPYKVSEEELKSIEMFARMGAVMLRLNESSRLNLSRRKGFEQVTKLLKFSELEMFESNPSFIVDHVRQMLPTRSLVYPAIMQPDGSFMIPDHDLSSMASCQLNSEEIGIGKVLSSMRSSFYQSRSEVEKLIGTLTEDNRESLISEFGERGAPSFAAVCPVVQMDSTRGLLLMFAFGLADEEQEELERLLSLAVGLYSVGLSIEHVTQKKLQTDIDSSQLSGLGEIVNQLNNHLLALSGQAELGAGRDDISGETRQQFQTIVGQAQQAAGYVRKTLGQLLEAKPIVETGDKGFDLNRTIRDSLDRLRISDDLFMIDGRTREISLFLDDSDKPALLESDATVLFIDALEHFSSIGREDEVISVKTYLDSGFLFLDISRHRKNFPPVEDVSEFGLYQSSAHVLSSRPDFRFLEQAVAEWDYSYDRYSDSPSYLSFRFPLSQQIEAKSTNEATKKIRLLAIDDQVVILDLLSAMCQTLGFEIKTASSGQEGVELAATEKFDIILTDLAMPGLSGLEAARIITAKSPGIPIILITGWESTIDKSLLEQAGIVEVLYKPFRIEQLTDLINSTVNKNILS